MLRITVDESGDAIRFRLAGRLKGDWVAEMYFVYTAKKNAAAGKPIVFDLQNLAGADKAGRSLLALFKNEGATFENTNQLTASLLQAPVEAKR